jgi:threonine dehydrogenase-like Zn-dependent dehydrogenase
MNALTYQGIHRVEFGSAPEPALVDDGDALVEVELAGLCGSDLHVWHGRETGLDPGTVMGHECVGRITAIGPAVRRFAIGDRVAVPFTTCCGACHYCRIGLSARCVAGQLFGWVQSGTGLHGAQAQRVRVPFADATLCHVPADLDERAALLLCDVLPTGHYCAMLAGVDAEGTYAVVGCGPVGLMAILAARELGARRIYALDTVDERLGFAARLGATPIDARRGSPTSVLKEATGGRGADAVLEAVGSPEAGRIAWNLVRPGGTIAAVGVHHEAAFPFSPAAAYDRNLTYRIGRCPARSLMEGLIPLALRRAADLNALVTHRVPLSGGTEAYAMFDARRDGCIKVALEP